MKKLLLLLLAALPVVSFADDKIMFTGNWKEVKRMPINGSPIAFSDTIKIEFLMGNEYVWQKSGGFIYKGTYKVNSRELDMGSRFFTIVERTTKKLTLKDETATYVLETYTPTSQQTVLPPEKAAGPVRNLEQMIGHWSVFKATNDKTVQSIDYSRKIKMIDITGNVAGDGKLGMVFSTHDADTAPSWYIDSYSNQTLYCNGKDKRVIKVLKCENNELVVEEAGMTYFFRQFK